MAGSMHFGIPKQAGLACAILLSLLLAGCTQSTGPCTEQLFADLSEADTFAEDDALPFRLPLDDASIEATPDPARFGRSSRGDVTPKYHAAEDFHRPAGTPVYAMADGEISFSGRMRGYGWLIIVDHPQANIYSLYGHLSPSRWRAEPGPVQKGQLIAYLGDSDENGGSAENPLVTHLHLGVRAGQRTDYSAMGELRWQAGWIKPCPSDVGWLQPSEVIVDQNIPEGGFADPEVGFLEIWWMELLFAGIYLVGAAGVLLFALRKDKHVVVLISGAVLTAAGWLFSQRGSRLSYALFAVAALLITAEVYRLVRRRR